MKFIAGLVRYWGLNLGAWAGAVAGVAYFAGYVDQAEEFFKTNRELGMAFLLLHFALCAIIYHAGEARRLASEAISILERSSDD